MKPHSFVLFLLLVPFVVVFSSGCCSPSSLVPHPSSLLSISINVQLGGTRTDPSISTRNDLGAMATQTHTLPVDAASTAGATSLSIPTP